MAPHAIRNGNAQRVVHKARFFSQKWECFEKYGREIAHMQGKPKNLGCPPPTHTNECDLLKFQDVRIQMYEDYELWQVLGNCNCMTK
jgi:hypothetical protein